MNSVYKEPSIYGKDSSIIDKIVWEDITNKIGSFNTTNFERAGYLTFLYCRELGLIRVTGYGQSDAYKNLQNTVAFNFNHDLPGNSTKQLFSGNGIIYTRGNTSNGTSIIVFMPNDTPSIYNVGFAAQIRFEINDIPYNYFTGLNVFLIIDKDYIDQFNNYLDAK